MGAATNEVTFSEWLREQFDRMAELEGNPSWGARTCARRIDPHHPESARRAINRHLHDGDDPSEEWRDKYAAALGVDRDEMPGSSHQEVARPGDPFRGSRRPAPADRSRRGRERDGKDD